MKIYLITGGAGFIESSLADNLLSENNKFIVIDNFCDFYAPSIKEDNIKEALIDGCNKDAPGSFINWLYNKSKVYTMEMPGKRYDIGNLESYNDVNKNYNGIIEN